MRIKVLVLLLMFCSCATYVSAGEYDDGSLRGVLPGASAGVEQDASQPGLRGLEGNVDADQPAPFEGANLPRTKSNKVKKMHHQSGKKGRHGTSPAGPDLSPVGRNKKSGFDLADPAKTGIGLTDRTAKTGVGLTDKAVKEIFKAVF